MKNLKGVTRAVLGTERSDRLRRSFNLIRERGDAHYCPCCQSSLRRFKPSGLVVRQNALCPVCLSLERHRLIYLYLTQQTDLFDGKPKKMLHVAPEPQLARLFKNAPYIDYLSADLFAPAMVKMDITDIQYPDATFDSIYCSHVLEHVLDDRKAMREFHRVLKPTGWAILQVPITAPVTFEDTTVTSPEEREQKFGQHDHVRCYGPDYKERLTDAGFIVAVSGFARELGERNVQRFGLMESEDVYYCRKQA